jgi:hypothetical protein
MTLVEPNYLNEIFSELDSSGQKKYHLFLELDEKTLRERIQKQVISNDEVKDNEIRNWRLQHVDRCLAVKLFMPQGTIFLNSGKLSPDQLFEKVMLALPYL